MNPNQTNPKSFWPKHFSWLTIVLIVLTVVTFFAIYNKNGYYDITPMGIFSRVVEVGGGQAVPPMAGRMTTGVAVMEDGSSVSYGSSGSVSVSSKGADMMYYPSPYPNPDVPVTDTREFLKTYYSANMRARNVQGLITRVETIVRGHEGRIDNQSSAPKYAYLSFAVPQNKFDAFRSELESLVGSRFLTINISSQNLLSQKISIEDQQKQADTQLANYKTERQKIVSSHTSYAATLQAKIDKDNADLTSLRAQPETAQTLAEIKTISSDLAYQQKLLDSENVNYKNQLANADSNIKYTQDWQKAVQTQDKTLLENVATVSGTVSIQWISLWDSARVYLPGYSIPMIFAVLAFISAMYDKRRYVVTV